MGPMPTYSVITLAPDQRVTDAINVLYAGNFYHWSDRVSFVTASETAQQVAEKLGVKPKADGSAQDDGVTNIVVLKLAPSYWGFSTQEFWDWLQLSLQRNG
jgi:hypothetical protein